MALAPSSAGEAPARRDPDTTGPSPAQAAPVIMATRPARLRSRTLITLRWLALSGQAVTLLVVGLGFGFPVPYLPAFLLLGVGAALNLLVTFAPANHRPAGDWDAAAAAGLRHPATGRDALPDRRRRQSLRPAADRAGDPGRRQPAAAPGRGARAAGRRVGGRALGLRPAPALVAGRDVRAAVRLSPGAGVRPDHRHRLRDRLCLPVGVRRLAHGAGAQRHRDGARPRAAPVGPGRPGRRRRPRARHAARHHHHRRQGDGPRGAGGAAARGRPVCWSPRPSAAGTSSNGWPRPPTRATRCTSG